MNKELTLKRNNDINFEQHLQENLAKLDDSQSAAVQSDGSNILIKAPAGSGKALKNGTHVLTIQGWKPIECLTLKDLVAAEDGKFYSIIGIYPQGLKQIYKITFSDKSEIQCSGDHIWTWQSSEDRCRHKDRWRNSTTEELMKRPLQLNNGHWDVYLPQPEIIKFPEQEIPLDPYLLGALLGDGGMSQNRLVFTVAEEDLKEKIQLILSKYQCSLKYLSKYDYAIQGPLGFGYNNTQNYIGASLRDLGLTKHNAYDKFIPDIYKYNTEDIRLKILQGLIDTDGFCDGSRYDITLASKQLILDIQFICESLGFTAAYSEKKNSNKTFYRLYIKTSSKYPKIHTTKNKDSRWKPGQSVARRTIRSIEKTDNFAEMTCIEVTSPNHLFLTEHMIPTHNTLSLISAVANYRYENLADRICAITFTRAARAEMEQRLQEMGVFDVEVTTIHVWSRNLLEALGRKYHFAVEVLQENQIKSILEFIVENYLRTARIKSVNIGILYTYITGSKKMDITDNYRRTLNALEERYIKYKRENGLYDFTDYPLYLYNTLEAYNEDITTIDALFVDEFQDVDSVQFKIFEKVLAKKKFFIGDSWQSIYEFRGADGEVFNKLGEGFDIYKLKYNYRSYQEIINYATTVYEALNGNLWGDCYISQHDWCDYSSIQCERGEGGVVMVINPYKDGFQIIQGNNVKPLRTPTQAVYNFLKQYNPMILCRTNKQVKGIQELGWINTTTIHQAKGLEYDNVVVVDTAIKDSEDLNVAYVAMTRARDGLLVIPWPVLEDLLRRYQINPYGI